MYLIRRKNTMFELMGVIPSVRSLWNMSIYRWPVLMLEVELKKYVIFICIRRKMLSFSDTPTKRRSFYSTHFAGEFKTICT